MVRDGARLADIALALGIESPSAITMALGDDPDYLAARECSLEMRLEQREAELEGAARTENIARVSCADRLLNHARWRCEREAPHRWGVKQSVTHNMRGNVQVDLGFADALLQNVRTFDQPAAQLPAPPSDDEDEA